MITIDRISFEFAAIGEDFVHGLYADWEDFCRNCFEKVVEECFSAYDKDKVWHEITQLDLDLGGISEDDFYQEFPRRLREELLRVMPSWCMQTADEKKRTDASRLANLLFYLEHGYLKVEWADSDFSLTEELDWAVSQPISYTDEIVKLCLKKEYVLRRLLWYMNDEKALVNLCTVVLPGLTFGLHEKRRFLEIMLEMKPGIPVRFIHETADSAGLHNMAELLNTLSVRRIMETEAEEHAEVDLPPYWHYLYEWLVKYYPFNGLAVFGGKGNFIHHLNHRLLTFIYKRNYSFYLSKAELTTGFLLEVFGSAYYIEVLNAIYDLQPHHADGSPVYDGYLNRELYGIFLQLSLLKMPAMEDEKKKETVSGKEKIVYPASAEILTAYLEDTQRSNANKWMLLRLLVKEKPEITVNWLKTEIIKGDAAVSALVSVITEMADDAIINRLLASVSFRIVEVVGQVRDYLRSHASEISWLSGISESWLNFVLRKSILLWIGNGHVARSESESIRQLLCLIYQEMTGGDKEEDFERLSMEFYLLEEDWNELIGKKETSSFASHIKRLKTLLADKDVPEPIKRRILASFLEQYKENYADVVLSLHEQGVLEDMLNLIGQPALEEIIRQLLIRVSGTYRITELLSLLYWLVIHESDISTYLRDTTSGLKVQLLVWLTRVAQLQIEAKRTVTQMLPVLLAELFSEENIPSVISLILREQAGATENALYYDMETALGLLLDTGLSQSSKEYPPRRDLKKWLHQSEDILNVVQTLLESRWNTDEGFTDWLEDTAVSEDVKRKLLQKLAVEKPREWIRLLRKQSQESKAILLSTTCLSASQLLQGMVRVDFHQASILSKTVEWLQRKVDKLTFLSGNNMLLSTALSKALLLYIQDEGTLSERTLTENETLSKFLSYLHLVYTGKPDYRDDAKWVDLSGRIATEQEPLVAIMERQPEQMEDYFISRLFVRDPIYLPIGRITDTTLPESIRRRLLHGYIRFQPKELSDYIRRSVERNIWPLDKWLEWMDISEWMRILANFSLSRAELLQQIMTWLSDNNQIKESELSTALATCLINNRAEEWIYNSREETIYSFIHSLPFLQAKTKIEKEIMEKNIKEELKITKVEDCSSAEEQMESPEVLFIGNAGLCLLSPWLPRLFVMLGYLDGEKRNFKDTVSRIRAVFLLQYLVCPEEKEYREPELAFNRLLVALPAHIPLPKRIELTNEEKQAADSLMEGVKANWSKMNGTSVNGFRLSFIVRDGRLEQQDEKWLLTVEKRAYDILLDSVPWSFRQIRFPWLQKYVQAFWHEM
ncbi:contractile injection system tape measure protein [Bacteroides oleiciplenus]|uniref:Uncharacterized protein n=1 Tax=Bacteroides oleiciplenus YIT 12058 TaxID=742727 RepID=K9E5R3_9BACE|nr:contractile injection system tape measure protein [Bacteroides oleiciplenus]EKU91176.1 hypothetical protein HMPREF9447_01366 [Bacteroides oleiciplenus YIT 12058]